MLFHLQDMLLYGIHLQAICTQYAQAFDDDKDKVMFFYRDTENGNDLTYKIITSGASSFSVATGAEISANNNKFGPGSASFGTGKGVLLGIQEMMTILLKYLTLQQDLQPQQPQL